MHLPVKYYVKLCTKTYKAKVKKTTFHKSLLSTSFARTIVGPSLDLPVTK